MKSLLATLGIVIVGLIGNYYLPESQNEKEHTYRDLIPNGKVLVQFNASFNKSHQLRGLENLKNVKYKYIQLDNNFQLKSRFKIHTLPTIIYFENKKEVKRWEGNIMMELDLNSNYFKNYNNLK